MNGNPHPYKYSFNSLTGKSNNCPCWQTIQHCLAIRRIIFIKDIIMMCIVVQVSPGD